MGSTGYGRLSRCQCARFDSVMERRFGVQCYPAQISVMHPFSQFGSFDRIWILHFRPDLINWREVRSRMNTRQRLDHAFGMAEREFGVTRLLDPEGEFYGISSSKPRRRAFLLSDVEVAAPDERSMMTYISTLYDALPDRPAAEKVRTKSKLCQTFF